MSSSRYLLCYNIIAWLLWLLVLNRTFIDSYIYLLPNVPFEFKVRCVYVIKSAAKNPHRLLIAVQNMNAIFEIIHAGLGLVKSSLPITCLQFFARLLITIGICQNLPQSPANWTFGSFIGLSYAWTITELFRYGYYIINYFYGGKPPYALKWLRYSLFIVLYPLGLACEWITVYLSIPYAGGLYRYYLIFGLVLYIPGFIQLYRYMWRQRRKVLKNKVKK